MQCRDIIPLTDRQRKTFIISKQCDVHLLCVVNSCHLSPYQEGCHSHLAALQHAPRPVFLRKSHGRWTKIAVATTCLPAQPISNIHSNAQRSVNCCTEYKNNTKILQCDLNSNALAHTNTNNIVDYTMFKRKSCTMTAEFSFRIIRVFNFT